MIKACVVIPTYNNPNTIGQIIAECLIYTDAPILVVDDGSEPAVKQILPPINDQRLTLLRHECNTGKGAALQTAFSWARKNGFSHVLAMDGDGQHFAKDLELLLAESRRFPECLIIGSRAMDRDNSPAISRFGRFLSNLWIFCATKQRIPDTQSGMRLYPLRDLVGLELRTKRYDFEMEILLKLLSQGIKARSVDIRVDYPDRRVTHFKLVQDNLRIATLNLSYVLEAMVKKLSSAKAVFWQAPASRATASRKTDRTL